MQAHLTDGYKGLYHQPQFLTNLPTQNQSQTCLYALYVQSQRSEEERPWKTSRDQEMERLQEQRKMMHRVDAGAADAAAAAMRCRRTARYSGAAGRSRDRRQSTLNSSHRPRGWPPAG